MPNNPNKLSNFWQELKRRKVLRVITVYAAVAFVILQLVEILAPSLRLPEWTMNLILVLLIVGFIIAVILSWIYDVHPEGGIVKTEPAEKVKAEDMPKSPNSWRIASYISFVVIVALIVLNIIPRANNKREILDKSIAVLPFKNDSPDEEKMYFINGTMEAILDNLCKIEDLRVPGRTSVEQYRNISKPIPEIAMELNVSYILEGSGQKLGNRILLTVQLLDGESDKHLWSKQYNREIKQVEDLLSIPGEIAQLVAVEIEAIISPEEKQLIEKIPTTSLTAHDLYQRGRDKYNQYWLDSDNRTALERAEKLYYDALDYDSTFAQAYTGLALVYWDKHYWESYFSESFLDSVLILADKALSFDPQLSDAYTVRGAYYGAKGQDEQAISEYEKAIQLNPNDWMAYYGIGSTYRNHDLVKALDNLHEAASLNRGSSLPTLLNRLAFLYQMAGFLEKCKFYGHEAYLLDGDSISYYNVLAVIENILGNRDKYLKSLELIYLMDTTHNGILQELGITYGIEGKFEESLKYLKKYFERLEGLGSYRIPVMHRLGYAYWENGFYAEADYYFDTMIEYYNELSQLGRQGNSANYDLAGVYAFRGEKDRAYENLRKFNELERIPLWWLHLFRIDPLFDSLRNEPEFQQILRDLEAKFQAEHERVRQWLEENDML